ncbi:MAG: hypothetical protein M3Y55_01045 [Pseudomonadota bacterium]|nr:hypothetical protein [Pseudomonadota bacterium]
MLTAQMLVYHLGKSGATRLTKPRVPTAPEASMVFSLTTLITAGFSPLSSGAAAWMNAAGAPEAPPG